MSGYEVVTATTHSGNLASGASLTARASCTGGKRPLGGGVQAVNAFGYAVTTSSYPDAVNSAWVGEIRNSSFNSGGATDVIVYAICAAVQ